MRSPAWALAFASLACAQSPSPHRLRADLRFLSSDLLEGRAPGTRGDLLTAEYLRARFTELGLKTTFQAVPLIGVETLPTTRIGAFTWLTDVAGRTGNLLEENNYQLADVVFAGHGIDAPEFKWDDYGDIVVRGKIVVLIAGEPSSDDSTFFAGPARTPYAEAEYKFAEATRRGAIAALIIHTPETAGFSWDTVRALWAGERLQPLRPIRQIVTQPASPQTAGMQFEGWVTKPAAAKWLETDIDALIAEADKPGFRARRLEKRMAGRVASRVRTLATRNVIAIAPGSDPLLADEAVLFTAHLDHLGTAPQPASGSAKVDTIYNGAVDNATGLAVLLEIARLWTTLDPAPARSAVFVATAAEEPGSRGAEAYVAAPAVPLTDTKLAINLHSYLPLGRTRDFALAGAERSPLWPQIRHTVERFGLEVKAAAPADFASDAATLARAGVAAFTLRPGADYSSEPARKAQLIEEHLQTRHRQPGDEYNEDWDISGLEQLTSIGLEVALTVANAPAPKPPPAPAAPK